MAVAVALALAFQVRRSGHWAVRGAAQVAGMGYAIPGAVVVVGLLLERNADELNRHSSPR